MECENGVCKLPAANPTSGAAAAAAAAANTVATVIPDQFKSFPWSHLVNAAGKRVPTSALQRPLTMYLFSAAWCPPCQKLAPTIEALHKAHRETDVDIVYVGFDKTHEEHRAKAKLPYFKFTWFQDEELQVPIPCEKYKDQPGNANPFRMAFRDALLPFDRMGIPFIVVADAATGKVIDDDATLPLFHVTGSKTLDADLKAIVSRWRAGQRGSTRWMRIRSTVVDGIQIFWYFYIVFPVLDTLDWIKAKFTKSIEAAPESTSEVKREADQESTKPAEAAAMEEEKTEAPTVETEAAEQGKPSKEPTMECEGGVCQLPAAKKESEPAQAA